MPMPAFGVALDALAVGVVPARTAVPVRAARLEVEPQLLGDDTGLVVDLDLERAPAGQMFVVEPGGITGDHHLAGQRLQDPEERDMVGVRVVEAVAATRPARRLHVGRVAVDQLAPLEREVRQEAVGAAVNQFHSVVATERPDGPGVEIDADVAQCPVPEPCAS